MANFTKKCDICGERHDCVDLTYDGHTYTVCEKCASEHFARSTVSGDWYYLDKYWDYFCEHHVASDTSYKKLFHNGLFISAHEYFGQMYRWCADCGLPHKYNKTCVDCDGNEHTICCRCFNEYWEGDYVPCADCGRYFDPSLDDGETSHDGDYVCTSCYESGDWRRCADCGELYYRDDDRIRYSERRDAYICDNCWDSDCDDWDDEDYDFQHIHDYGYKPKGIFRDTDEDVDGKTLYFGTENEMSHDDNDERYEHSEFIAAKYGLTGYESHFYQKEDSSLECGIEIVSHPMSLSYWHSIEDMMDSCFAGSRRYTAGEADGLHVHVSRNGMSVEHEHSFAMFAQFCRLGIEVVARRDRSSYAKFLPETCMDKVYKNRKYGEMMGYLAEIRHDRYNCVNWQNSRTVEVRAFKSTLNVNDFYAAIELCHAWYQFTKLYDAEEIFKMGVSRVLWDVFLNYCADDRRYSHLFTVLYREDPTHLGSNLYDDSVWSTWFLPQFEELDTFLSEPLPITGGMILSRLCVNAAGHYYDSETYEDVEQPASIQNRDMELEMSEWMSFDWTWGNASEWE